MSTLDDVDVKALLDRIDALEARIDESENRLETAEGRVEDATHSADVENYANAVSRGDGTIRSARTHFDIAALVMPTKPVEEAGGHYAVYTLVCENPYTDGDHAVNRAVVGGHDVVVPRRVGDLRDAGEAPVVFYVGFSKDVVQRLHDHATGSGGLITELFTPRRIADVEWFRDESDARAYERTRAAELGDDHPEAYIGGGR